MSTVESSGWVRLERMSGIASKKTRRYQWAIGTIVAGRFRISLGAPGLARHEIPGKTGIIRFMLAATAPLPIPVPATDAHFYKYAEFTDQKQERLKEILLEHKLYLPTLDQLNDPADGKPKLAVISEEKLFNFLYQNRLSQNPNMSPDQQIHEGLVLDHNLKQHGTDLVTRRLSRFLNNELNDWRIYCLSKRWDNLRNLCLGL